MPSNSGSKPFFSTIGSESRSSRFFQVFSLITFSGLGLLILLTVFALRRQASVEAGNDRQNAITRISSAAAAFHQTLHVRLLERPSVLLRSDRLVQDLRVDSSLVSAEHFLSLAAASEPYRLTKILEAAINAAENERPFWWLLAVHHLADDNPDLAEPWARRLIRQKHDWQLPDRPSASNLAILKVARGFARKGNPEKTADWLKTMQTLTPLGSKFDLKNFWGSNAISPEWSETFDLADIVWSRQEPRSNNPGWHSIQVRAEQKISGSSSTGPDLRDSPKTMIWFVFQSGDRTLATPARHEWKALQLALAEAAGPSFETTIGLDTNTFTISLPELQGAKARMLPVQAVSTIESHRHLLLITGVALALGGLLSMLFLFTRREQLAEIRTSREELYRQAAHDLKTPLTTLRALAETLSLGRTRDQAQQERYLHSLVREVDQAERVVDGMLLAARLEAGTVQPRFELIEPVSLVADVLNSFEARLEGWKVQTVFSDVVLLSADSSLVKRVLINLIENSLRHAYSGRELVIESRFCRSDPLRVALTVADRGPGPYHAVESSGGVSDSLVQGSSRFGLEVVRRIMEIQNGSFELIPRIGGGSEAITLWPIGKENKHAPNSNH